jgi:hypothetical protein
MDTFEDKSFHKCSTWLSSYDELASYLLSPELINFLLLLQYAVMSTLRAGPPVLLSRWPCKRKLDEEKLKTCRFGSAKLFWPCIFAQDAEQHLLLIG